MKDKKIISIIAIVLIVVLVLGATYAYFATQSNDSSSTDINVTTATTDNLTFETGDVISINATQSNFASGLDSLSDDTYAKASLVANNDTNSASANYYVQVYIGGNTFEHTTDDETAELLLVITDPDGNTVTSLNGLTYTTVSDNQGTNYNGFDITTYNGIITVADLYEITSTSITTQEWSIEVIFVNLATDQSANAGASLTGFVYIGVDQVAYHEVCNDNTLACTVAQLTTTSSSNLYYHAEDVSDDNTGTAYGTCYYDGVVVSSYSGNTITESDCSNVYKLVDTDSTVDYSYDYSGYYSDELINTYLYNDSVSVSWDSESSACEIDSLDSGTYSLYLWHSGGVNYTITENECTGQAYQWEDSTSYYLGIEFLGSGEWMENTATLGAQDNSYRYSGASDEVDNWVCFGSDEVICPDDSLYRIIGVFQNDEGTYEVKLIKADYANSDLLGTDGDYSSYTYSASSYSNYTGSHTTINGYYWNYVNYTKAYNANGGYYNDWRYSQLNIVNLNINYLNSLDSVWQDMIAIHTWVVGGISMYGNAKVNYLYEITNPSTQLGYTTNDAKVGLMYISDFSFAADSTYWNTVIMNYNSATYAADWMYGGVEEWTISRYSSIAYGAFLFGTIGYVVIPDVYGYYYAVRPTFYLNTSVTVTSGHGTYSSPYRISMS